MPEAAIAPAAPVAPPAAGKSASAAKPGVAPAVAGGAAAAAPEAFLELVIDGQKRQFTRAEAERYVSKGGFADKTTQQAKEQIKAAAKFKADLEAKEQARISRAKSDTEAFLKEHGLDIDELARARLDKKIEEGKMTAEQREAAALKAENQRLKDEQAKRDQEAEAQRQTNHVKALQANVEKNLVDAAGRAGIEPGDESFYAIYESFREMFELGLLPVDGLQPHHADRIIEDAKSRLDGAQQSLEKAVLTGLKGEKLLTRLGPAVVQEVLNARLAQIHERRNGGTAKPSGGGAAAPVTPVTRPSSYLTPAEADAQMKKILAQGTK